MNRKERANERRDEILETTMRVLAFEGDSSVTMRSIADRLGISLSNLQYYFPTRRELLKSTIEKSIGSIVRQIDEMTIDSIADPIKILKKAVKMHLSASRDPFISKFFAAIWALATYDKDVEELVNEIYERDCHRYAALIHRANPKLSKKICETRAVLIVAQIEGLVLFIAPGKLRATKARAIERELDSLIDSVAISS